MTFCLFQTIIWFAKIDLLDVAEECALSYPIQSLIKDGLTLKILFMNVYGCRLDLIVSPGKSRALSWAYYTAPPDKSAQDQRDTINYLIETLDHARNRL